MNWNILAGVAFALFGLFLLWQGIRAVQRGRASQHWATTTGTVLHTELADHQNDEGHVTFTATINYEYEVAGLPYQSTKYNAEGTPHLNSLRQAQRIADSYATGSTIKVFYDPENPKETLLETGVPHSSWTTIAMGVIFLGVGIYIFWAA